MRPVSEKEIEVEPTCDHAITKLVTSLPANSCSAKR
jgi:hypothetical protein